jgi:hypothetical protein
VHVGRAVCVHRVRVGARAFEQKCLYCHCSSFEHIFGETKLGSSSKKCFMFGLDVLKRKMSELSVFLVHFDDRFEVRR